MDVERPRQLHPCPLTLLCISFPESCQRLPVLKPIFSRSAWLRVPAALAEAAVALAINLAFLLMTKLMVGSKLVHKTESFLQDKREKKSWHVCLQTIRKANHASVTAKVLKARCRTAL